MSNKGSIPASNEGWGGSLGGKGEEKIIVTCAQCGDILYIGVPEKLQFAVGQITRHMVVDQELRKRWQSKEK